MAVSGQYIQTGTANDDTMPRRGGNPTVLALVINLLREQFTERLKSIGCGAGQNGFIGYLS